MQDETCNDYGDGLYLSPEARKMFVVTVEDESNCVADVLNTDTQLFDWSLFALEPPPKDDECGLYIVGAEYIRQIAAGCWKCRKVIAKAPLKSGCSHADAVFSAQQALLLEDGNSDERCKMEWYRALVVALSAFERCLYDLYCQATDYTIQILPILRALLLEKEMEATLPAANAGKWLHLLFSPRGVNLRNLIWHGFVGEEASPHYAALVILLYQSLPASAPRPFWMSERWDAKVESVSTRLSGTSDKDVEQECIAIISSSAFPAKGRRALLCEAIRRYVRGEELSTLCFLLPALEQSLRIVFAKVNTCSMVAVAHCEKYYTTLDGIGQAYKHQLLLEPQVRDVAYGKVDASIPPSYNKLHAAIGIGYSAALQDLFMSETGPCLRGKLAHGEMPMNIESSSRSNLILMLISASIGLISTQSNIIPKTSFVQNACSVFQGYRPLFHPVTRLEQELTVLRDHVHKLSQICSRCRFTVTPVSDADSLLEVSCGYCAEPHQLRVKDKHNRFAAKLEEETKCLMQITTSVIGRLQKQQPSVLLLPYLQRIIKDEDTNNLTADQFCLRFDAAAPELPVACCLFDCTHYLTDICIKLSSYVAQLSQPVCNRTARTAERRSFSSLILMIKPLCIAVFTCIGTIEWMAKERDASFVTFFQKLMEMLGSVSSDIEQNNVQRASETLLFFFDTKIAKTFLLSEE